MLEIQTVVSELESRGFRSGRSFFDGHQYNGIEMRTVRYL
jgi:hypothetical protein